jgi:hypothetical protein
MSSSLLLSACCLGAGSEAEAVVSGLDDMATVGQAIEERGRHLGVAEDRGPFAEAEVGGDGDAVIKSVNLGPINEASLFA